MKSGHKTTEFYITVGSSLVTGSTAILSAVGAIQDQVSGETAAVLGVVALIALAAQAAGYSMSRASIKNTDMELQIAIERRMAAGLMLEQHKSE